MSAAASAGSATPAVPAALPAQTGAAPPLRRCDNCGAPLAQRYCGACGQKAEPPVHSLWQFIQHAAEDVTHADSRLWRTLWALLFRPGYLTREFLCGRRARYLPPVRLYLVLSVVFFLYASGTHDQLKVLQLDDPARGVPEATIPSDDQRNPLRGPPGESTEARVKRICGSFAYDGPWQGSIRALWQRTCPRVVVDTTTNNGRTLDESFIHNLPRAMFVFLPLLAGVMMLLYWRPRHYYVEHLLLLVHNHAFVFLSVVLTWLITVLLPFSAHSLPKVLLFYTAWYVYRSMRVVYGQGRLLTIAKLLVLGFVYLCSGAAMMALDVVYSALTL